jgi:hypothetical protein
MKYPETDNGKDFPDIGTQIAFMSTNSHRKILLFDELITGERYKLEENTNDKPKKDNQSFQIQPKHSSNIFLKPKQLSIQTLPTSSSKKQTLYPNGRLIKRSYPTKTFTTKPFQTILTTKSNLNKYLTQLPSINRTEKSFTQTQINLSQSKTRNKKQKQTHLVTTCNVLSKQQTVKSHTSDKLNALSYNCLDIRNGIKFMKKSSEESSAKMFGNENADDAIDKEIKGFVKDEPSMTEIQLLNKRLAKHSKYASRMNEKFAYDAGNVIGEIFDRENVIAKRKRNNFKRERENMQKMRLTLRVKTDNILKNYATTISRCYQTLGNF